MVFFDYIRGSWIYNRIREVENKGTLWILLWKLDLQPLGCHIDNDITVSNYFSQNIDVLDKNNVLMLESYDLIIHFFLK